MTFTNSKLSIHFFISKNYNFDISSKFKETEIFHEQCIPCINHDIYKLLYLLQNKKDCKLNSMFSLKYDDVFIY